MKSKFCHHKIAYFAGLVLLLSTAACQSSPPPQEDSPIAQSPPVAEEESTQVDDDRQLADETAEAGAPHGEPTEEDRQIAEQVTDEDLRRFAAGVRALAAREQLLIDEGRDYDSRRAEATGPADVAEIEGDIMAEMNDALAEEGLEWESFMRFAAVIRANPILMERLEDHLEDEEIAYFFGG